MLEFGIKPGSTSQWQRGRSFGYSALETSLNKVSSAMPQLMNPLSILTVRVEEDNLPLKRLLPIG